MRPSSGVWRDAALPGPRELFEDWPLSDLWFREYGHPDPLLPTRPTPVAGAPSNSDIRGADTRPAASRTQNEQNRSRNGDGQQQSDALRNMFWYIDDVEDPWL